MPVIAIGKQSNLTCGVQRFKLNIIDGYSVISVSVFQKTNWGVKE